MGAKGRICPRAMGAKAAMSHCVGLHCLILLRILSVSSCVRTEDSGAKVKLILHRRPTQAGRWCRCPQVRERIPVKSLRWEGELAKHPAARS